jgi:hypothetical protein
MAELAPPIVQPDATAPAASPAKKTRQSAGYVITYHPERATPKRNAGSSMQFLDLGITFVGGNPTQVTAEQFKELRKDSEFSVLRKADAFLVEEAALQDESEA